MKQMNKFFKLVNYTIRRFTRKSKFGIAPGYKHRDNFVHLDKVETETNEWQIEVYDYALKLMEKNNYSHITDFGCGSAKKLMENFKAYDRLGVEVKETVEKLNEIYPNEKWLVAEGLDTSIIETDLVICADVIEHVLEPDKFLMELNKIKFKHLIISTPDRMVLSGCYDYGPPKNQYHIREWTGKEFYSFVKGFFDIELQQITNYQQGTQMLVCRKK